MEKHPHVFFDNFVIMPNHIHILISLSNGDMDMGMGTDTARRVPTIVPTIEPAIGPTAISTVEQFGKPTKNSIPTIIRSLKSAITNEIRKTVGTRRAVSVQPHSMSTQSHAMSTQSRAVYEIWQSRYHDHIVRNENEYHRIWRYIDENPLRWANDKFHGCED